jgi:hypothetical protein
MSLRLEAILLPSPQGLAFIRLRSRRSRRARNPRPTGLPSPNEPEGHAC